MEGVAEGTTPRKGHHRWVDSAMERSSYSLHASGGHSERLGSSVPGLRPQPWSRPSRLLRSAGIGGSGGLAEGRGTDDQGWEEASLAAKAFLLSSRSDDLERVPQLRFGMLDGSALDTGLAAGRAREVELARAEYDELRTMHLLFVEASNKKMADLQEACRLRQMEIEALRLECAAEKKERDRFAGELEATRHTLAERGVELQIAHDALQPFLAAREGLLEDAVRSQRLAEYTADGMKQGILKKLVKEVPLLERALDRDERLRETTRKNVHDKQVVLVATIAATRDKARQMCQTLRSRARKMRAQHALRNVLLFERQQRAMLKALRAQVEKRLMRSCFTEFIHQAKQNNTVRRRGYLVSMRHLRLVMHSVFSAWRWAHFAGRWLPTAKPPLLSDPDESLSKSRTEVYGMQLQSSTSSTRHALMAMTQSIWQDDNAKETGDALHSFSSTMNQSRQVELQARIGPQISSADCIPTFDPENLAIARAKENFEKAGKVWSRECFEGASVQKVLPASRDQDANVNEKLDISSDSSLDDVLEEVEKESRRWAGRHKRHHHHDAAAAEAEQDVPQKSDDLKPARYSSPAQTPPSSPIRPTPNAALGELQESLRRFYEMFSPGGHPDPFHVAQMYSTDIVGLNAALLAKYGATLQTLEPSHSYSGAQETTDEIAAADFKARRRKVMEMLHDDSPMKVESAAGTRQRRFLEDPVLRPVRVQTERVKLSSLPPPITKIEQKRQSTPPEASQRNGSTNPGRRTSADAMNMPSSDSDSDFDDLT